ncbi:MAG: preprotein translocase subunit SecG [Planctomycetota bacterium]|jgi:protein translocase SecG subunit
MSIWFWITTLVFIVVSASMVLIILVQRPQGGGLAGAFGGAGGAGTETVFGGRVGDALTWATVTAFVLYLALAITLNLLDTSAPATPPPAAPAATAPPGTTPETPGDTTTGTGAPSQPGGSTGER